VLLALLIAALLIWARSVDPAFVSLESQQSFADNVWGMALLAVPMTLIIITAGIDLSVGSTMALSAVVLGMSYRYGLAGIFGHRVEEAVGLNIWVSTFLALLTGTLCGLINGLFVVKLRVHPLLVTLATLAAFKGIAEGISAGQSVSGFPESFTYLGNGTIAGLPVAGVMFAILALITAIILIKTPLGRYLYAMGHNETATRFSGAPVDRYKLLLYTFTGTIAALAAVIRVARYSAKADAGDGMELDVITAVVLGGTSIFGGRGNILGTILGVLLVHETRELVPWHWQKSEYTKIVIGVLLISSVLLNRLLSVRRRGN
jgi:rhamnose transport system permease protein